jgi:signal transduction histidine kinase
MPFLLSRTSVKLTVGFVAILLLFLWAAVLTLQSVAEVEEANATMEDIIEGVRSGRRMTEIVRDQYIQLVQFVISRDWRYVDEFEELSRRMKPLKKRVAGQPIWTEDEKRIIARQEEAHRQFERLFEKEITEAVQQNDIDRVRRIRSQSEALLQEIVSLNGNLDLIFRRKLKTSQTQRAGVAETAKRSPFVFFGVAVLLSLVIIVYLGRSIADPIRKLIRGTGEIAHGNLSARIDLDRRDEFGMLAESFNRMTQELREHQQRIIQSEKMASLGQLAAGVAHEINNPIGVILGYTKVLLAEMRPGDRLYEELKAVAEEAQQCQRIVNELRNFSRPTELVTEAVDAREVADEALDRVERAEKTGASRITVAKDYGTSPQIMTADRGKLREVVVNIIQNAVDAMPEGGRIRVAVRGPETREPGENAEGAPVDFVIIEIADTGCGISEQDLKRIFEPFFSTKARGMGLGLAICHSIVKAHKGFIDVKSEPGRGTTFAICIPRGPAAQAPSPPGATPPATVSTGKEQMPHES